MSAAAISVPDRKMMFGMMTTGLNAIAPVGTRRCRKAMNAMDAAFFASSKTAAALALNPEYDVEARMLLRARCQLCPAKCKKALG